MVGTVQNVSRAYGQTNPVFTVNYTGFVNGQNGSILSGTLGFSCVDTNAVNVDTNTPVGTYPIQVTSGQTAPNYVVSYQSGTLTVTQTVLTVAANATNRVYGATNPVFTATITGYVNGENSSVLVGALSLTSSAVPASAVGTYSIIPSGVTATNYSIQFTNGVLTVTQAPLIVSANNTNRLYGQSNPALTGTVVGAANGDNLGVTFVTAATPASAVGNYNIVPAFADPGNKLGNYQVTTNTGTLAVGQTSLTVAAASQTRGYGQTNSTLTGSVSGVMNGDTITASYSTTATPTSPAGPYAIVPSLNDPQSKLGNYSVSSINGTLTITQAVLVVSADPQSRLYGATNPVLTVSYSGFVNSEGTNVLSGQPALSTAANSASPVGSYDIVVGLGSLSATNYSFSLTNGTLTVGKALLTVTADNQGRLYGQTNPVFTVHYSGFVDGDGQGVLSGLPALSTAAVTNTPTGGYAIVVTNGTLSATNYALGFVNGTLTINPAALSITGNDASRQYGQTNPVLTVTMVGFVNGEGASALAGTLSITTAADAGSSVGTYDIIPSGLSSTNYAVSYTNGTLTVTQAPLTVTGNSTNRVYGQANPALTGTYSGTLNGDNLGISFVTAATPSSPAAQYPILPAFADPAGKLGNYLVTTNPGTLTVTPALLTVTADDQSRLYGQQNPPLTVSYSGFVNGDNAATLQVQPVASTAAGPGSFIGPYAITVGGAVSSNYTFNYVPGTLTVQQEILTVLGDSASRAYGQTNPVFTSTITGVANGDNITVGYTTVATPTSPPGGYIIVLAINDPDGKLGNYDLTLISGVLTVTNASLIVSADNQNRLYGQTNSPFTVHYNGFVNGQGTNVLNGALVFSCRDGSNTPVGTNTAPGSYSINVSGPTATNYTITFVPGTLAIAKAPLSIVGTSAQRAYGAPNPTFTATLSGFVNGETAAVLSGALSVTSSAGIASPVGSYPIVPSGLTSGNYSMNYTNGSLTVTPAWLAVTANSTNKVYGYNLVLAGTEFTATGLLNSDTITNVTLSSLGAGAGAGLGNYSVAATNAAGSGLGNYTISYTNGVLTVTPASLTVTANSASKTYGQTVTFAGTEFSATGLLNSDTVTNVALASGGAAATAAVGSYSIVPSVAQGVGLTNYLIGYTNGLLSVGQELLTVTANAQTKTYGTADPALTNQVTSGALANGDGFAGSLIRVTGENVGNYLIQQGTLTAGSNYSMSYVSANLRITRRSLQVQADNKSRSYGVTNPVFTATYTGFASGDGPGSLAGTLAFNTSATVTSPVGGYSVVASGLSSPNYVITYPVGTLTIGPASLTGVVQNAQRGYGQTNPVFTVSYSGFVNSENSGIVTGTLGFSCVDTNAVAVDTNTMVGQYPIHVVTPQTAANYTIGYVDGTLTITQAVLVVSADPQSRLYGATNPVLTVSYSGFVNSEGTNVLSGQPALSTAANSASPVGSYDIVVGLGSLSATNYSFSLTNGTLTVGKALLTVTADNQGRLYGQTNPVFTVHYSGFVDGDGQGVLSGLPALSTAAVTNTPTGGYAIVVTNGTLSATNYALGFVNGTLTINPAALSITGNDASRQYGQTNPVLTVTMVGFVNGEGASALGGTLSITTAADAGSSVGTYDIIPSGLSSTNYAVSYTNGTLTVTQAPLTVTATSVIRQVRVTQPGVRWNDRRFAKQRPDHRHLLLCRHAVQSRGRLPNRAEPGRFRRQGGELQRVACQRPVDDHGGRGPDRHTRLLRGWKPGGAHRHQCLGRRWRQPQLQRRIAHGIHRDKWRRG